MPHHQDADGACQPDCPDPTHDGPVVLALEPALLTTVTDLLDGLGVTVIHVPTPPTEMGGHRCYAAPTAGTPLDPNRPRVGPHLNRRRP